MHTSLNYCNSLLITNCKQTPLCGGVSRQIRRGKLQTKYTPMQQKRMPSRRAWQAYSTKDTTDSKSRSIWYRNVEKKIFQPRNRSCTGIKKTHKWTFLPRHLHSVIKPSWNSQNDEAELKTTALRISAQYSFKSTYFRSSNTRTSPTHNVLTVSCSVSLAPVN